MKQYRPDIDGLRAIAVLSVVVYHLNKAWMPGGYTGVDIFFVISGYLITRNIWGEMERGEFSFSNFYVRRIKRIAPAFLAMVAITIGVGALLLLPEDLLDLVRSGAWALVSMSNVYFWRYLDTGYFAESSDEVPLLHTWSLGVEEQFYFIWPVILLLLAGATGRRKLALAGAVTLGAASFVCAELMNVSAQKFAYYMLPARGGELMVGAILALLPSASGSTRENVSRWMADAIALLGLALIAYSLYGLNDSSRFPGLNALFPCAGAALLILSGGFRSRVNEALLALRPMVLIGLISYSLYLWHWPVLAFFRYFYGEIGGAKVPVALLAMTVLAVASYRFVELPARRWEARRWLQVSALYVAPSLSLLAVGAYVWQKQGLKEVIEASAVYSEGLDRIDRYTAPAYKFGYNCQLSTHDERILDNPRCIIPEGSVGAEPSVLLWGDSQAAHFIGVLGGVAERQGFRFRNATHSSCPPLFGGDYGVGTYKAGCNLFRPYIREALQERRFNTVVLSGAWATYDLMPGFRSDLEKTIREIGERDIQVVIIGQMPVFMAYNRECELRAVRIGGGSCQERWAGPDIGDSGVTRYLAQLAQRMGSGVSYVSARDLVCREGKCNPYVDERPVYYDASHLSMDGSWLLGRKLTHSSLYSEWLSALKLGRPIYDKPSTAIAHQPLQSQFVARVSPQLLGGYQPRFAHHVRSRAGFSPGDKHSGVVLEYWGIRSPELLEQIQGDLVGLGFQLKQRTQSDGVTRLDFGRSGAPQMSVNVGPLGALTPQSPQAEGIVYIRW